MLRVAPQLVRLQAYRSVYSTVSRFISHPHLREAFSFHSLLVGGNPFRTSSIYTLIHHLEREWGVFFPLGGTGRAGAGAGEAVRRARRHAPARLRGRGDRDPRRPRDRRPRVGRLARRLRRGRQQRRRRPHLRAAAAPGTARREAGPAAAADAPQHVAVRDLLRCPPPPPAPRAPQRAVRAALSRAARRHLRARHAGRRLLAVPPRSDGHRPVACAAGLRVVLRAGAGAAPRQGAARLDCDRPALRRPHPRLPRAAATSPACAATS